MYGGGLFTLVEIKLQFWILKLNSFVIILLHLDFKEVS
jgi:hypothetical protein